MHENARPGQRFPRHLALSILFFPAVGAFLACGGKVVDDEPGADAGPACAAVTNACQLPGTAPVTDACSECASASLCACHDLNPPANWSVPTSCDGGAGACMAAAGMVDEPACQVAAVEMARCMIGMSHEDCSTLYFAAHPGANEPLGMELGLYDCAVCAACQVPCAGAPNVATFCQGIH